MSSPSPSPSGSGLKRHANGFNAFEELARRFGVPLDKVPKTSTTGDVSSSSASSIINRPPQTASTIKSMRKEIDTLKQQLKDERNRLKEDLTCPVCSIIPRSFPVMQCTNGHITCKDCHDRVRRDQVHSNMLIMFQKVSFAIFQFRDIALSADRSSCRSPFATSLLRRTSSTSLSPARTQTMVAMKR